MVWNKEMPYRRCLSTLLYNTPLEGTGEAGEDGIAWGILASGICH
jgi:hypothetical protein